MVSAINSLIIEEQRQFMFGAIALAQVDVNNIVTAASKLPTTQFDNFINNSYGVVVSSYGDIIIAQTAEYYKQLREANGGNSDFIPVLPTWDETYELRKEASIEKNTSMKLAKDANDLKQRFTTDIVRQLNEYSFNTVGVAGQNDAQFSGMARSPRADACAFCRWKAYEFSIYTSKEDISYLNNILLHKSCRCVPTPQYVFTEDDYLNDARQALFQERFDEISLEYGLNPDSKRQLKELLNVLRQDYKYN